MIRLAQFAKMLVAASLLVAGPPIGFLWLGHLLGVPGAADAKRWIVDPLEPRFLAWAALVMAWMLWALLCTTAVTRVFARSSRHWLRRLHVRLPGPVRSLHAALLGVAAVSTSTSPMASAPAHQTTADIDSSPHATHLISALAGPRPHAAHRDPTTSSATAAVAVTRSSTRAPAVDAAARRPTGTVAGAPTTAAPPVRGGSRQALTVAVSASAAGPATATAVHLVAQHGGADAPAWPREASGGSCRVVRGDTLWDLADEHLGDPQRWREIYQLNRGRVQANGYALTDPDEIDVGWVLALPGRHRGAQPADPPITPPPLARQSPPAAAQTPSPPASPGTQQAVPSTDSAPAASTSSQTDSGDGVYPPPAQQPGSAAPSPTPVSPSGTGSPPASGSAPWATGADRGDQTPAASPLDGVDLPGGWITLGLGGGLLAAVTMLWRRRRHRYQPTPITSPRLDDPDLLPPLAAMTRIRASLRRAAAETLDDKPTPAPTVREYRAAAVKPELPPVGPSGTDLAGAAALPLSTGLGLTGDGALDAARGLLVATLASGSDDDPDAKGRAIISAGTLATLLGASAVDLSRLDRLTVTASPADAITRLEEEIIYRSRLIADAPAVDVQTFRDNDVHAEPLPQLLLIAEPPDPAWTNRLVTAIRLGHSVDTGAVLIGDWPTGTTLTVAADGGTGTDDAPRLAVLDTAAAIEMLGVLRDAHDDSDSPARAEPPQRPQTAPTPAEPGVAAEQDTERDPEPIDDTLTPATAPPAIAAPGASRLPVGIRVLGRPAVLGHDGQPSAGIRSKAIELLVYLAVNRHGADLSDIMEALFPDATMRRAGERLSTVVADLRKHIRRAAAGLDGEQTGKQRLEPIPNTGSRYHLDPDIVRVDWWTVLDHYQATATATDDDQRLSHLTAAIAAAGGALADGVDYDWIDTDREVVRRHRIKLHTHAAALLADTDPHQSWWLLEQACEIDPLCDEVARTTMRAAAVLGDTDAIRHRLKTLRDAVDAHGLELSDQTEALAQELLRQLASTTAVRIGQQKRKS